MSSLIFLRRIRVENANAIAGITWGFPAITHFLGFTHALSRMLTQTHELRLDGCAVVCHGHQIHAHTSGRDYQFAQTRNPLTREGKTASFNEEGRMHMTVSLLLECHGEIPYGEYGQQDLADYLLEICPTLRLAGGSIVRIEDISVLDMPASGREMSRIQWRLMPGFVLRDRSAWLGEHHQTLLAENPQATLLDAWLDFASLKIQAESPEEGEIHEGDPATWHRVPKPRPGYLVPIDDRISAVSLSCMRPVLWRTHAMSRPPSLSLRRSTVLANGADCTGFIRWKRSSGAITPLTTGYYCRIAGAPLAVG
ncbi:CRISPR type I-F/YPEST-associated protein Csy2 [Raoultella planticola]|uniref:CRISPR type I-F/YPEST-associated protein Csy2 n=1 Tax=Raoultella planticola TaxID=575 RepID=A0A485CYT9_RAOPL|nr:CRISPR type I-F/YPEST-associated protein Csy2 [Raoultella planticola]